MTELNFKTAFKYPFNRAKGMLNIFWIFLPIIGWFALGGYGVRIVQEFSKGKFKKLPTMKFSSDLKLGFMMFVKAIPFVVVYGILTNILGAINPWIRGLADFFLGLFVVPILSIHFINKQTVGSYFEVEIIRSVFDNLGDYVTALVKTILLGLIFVLMSIILIGIPANAFTKNIFLADFYKRKVKKK